MKVNWMSLLRILTVLCSQAAVIVGGMSFLDAKTTFVVIGVANSVYLALKCVDGELGISIPTAVKVLIIGFMLMSFLPSTARADDLTLDLGIFKADVQGNVDAGGMLNAFHKTDNDWILNTVSTNIGYIPTPWDNVKLDTAVGAITGPTRVGTVYGSVGYTWPIQSGSILEFLHLGDLKAGIGLGANFCQSGDGWNNVVGGLTVSANILNLFVPK